MSLDRKSLVKSFQQVGEEAYGKDFSADRVVEDLAKALTLGSYPTTAGATTTDAGPLRLQNLDDTMTSVLFSEQNIKLWPFITKVPSTQPYYEWNRRKAYGSARHGSAFAEGGAPKGSASQFQRQGRYVKFMGVRRGITHQLNLTGQLGGTQIDPVLEENRNGTMELLEIIERETFYADSTILSEAGQSVNYDGILKQSKDTSSTTTAYAPHVVNKAGAAMTFNDFEDAAQSLSTNGYVNNFSDLHCFMKPTILADLSKQKYSADRRLLGSTVSDFVTGTPLAGHETNFGRINFDPWIFSERVKGDAPLASSDTNAPTAPVAPTMAVNVPVVAGSLFTASYAGAYYYSVSFYNDSGESTATVSATAATVATNGSITITRPALTAGSPTAWRVYRGTLASGADAKWIADVAAATTTYEDKNTKIPGTGVVVILNRNPETLAIAQMTPLIKYPLAITTTQVEWLLLLYHVPVLKAGERIYIWENVGVNP